MSATKIEWTDESWNPVTGCTEVTPGCDHCYARTFAERWRGVPGHPFEQGFDVRLWPGRLDLPLRWRRPRRVFVNSMSDLFHPAVPDEFITRVFAVMAATPQHTYQILTKRHGRMRSLLSSGRFAALVQNAVEQLPHLPGTWRLPAADYDAALHLVFTVQADESMRPLPNVHLGVSAEDQQRAELRVPALLETPAAVRFVSAEPLLGPVDLSPWLTADPLLSWVIVGGESGPGARPMAEEWARGLATQCRDARVPVFVKQMGAVWARGHGLRGKGADPAAWPADLRVRQMPGLCARTPGGTR